jgi:hypothetical protein
MEVFVQHRSYPEKIKELFAAHQMDLGHEPEMISAVDEEWYSILVVDGDRALAHAISPKPIGKTGLYDVEPFMGYGGFLANSDDQSFLQEALFGYSEACRGLKIVAELIRFDPLLLNHQRFMRRAELNVVPAKPVIIVNCENDFETQILHFSAKCRGKLRRGLANFHVRSLDKSREIDSFRNLYEGSITRMATERHWLFSDHFYSKIAASPLFEIQSVWSNDNLAAAAVVGHHPTGSHYILAAHSAEYLTGAGERLIYEIARKGASRGQQRLMLGGGNTPASDDPLLLYKSKFAKTAATFYIGMFVHDRPNFEILQARAMALRPEIRNQSFFLKHRLLSDSAWQAAVP